MKNNVNGCCPMSNKKEYMKEYHKKYMSNPDNRDYFNWYYRTYVYPRIKEQRIKKNLDLKKEVLSHYSPELKCIKCSYNDVRALSLDHIEGNGRKHKLSNNINHMYRWVKKNNYPQIFQVLCMNCNWLKRYENNENALNRPHEYNTYRKMKQGQDIDLTKFTISNQNDLIKED